MSPVHLAATELAAAPADAPGLVVLPSLGTTVDLWRRTAALLEGRVHVVGVDLPGHGASLVTDDAVTVEDMADAVAGLLGSLPARAWHVAGDSLGGCVALASGLRHGQTWASVTMVASDAAIGDPHGWRERAHLVRSRGTEVMVSGSRDRWFAPGFVATHPGVAERLLGALAAEITADGYAACCEALSRFDARDALPGLQVPLLAVAGDADRVIAPQAMHGLAATVPQGRFVALDGIGHLPPVEAPDRMATLMGEAVDATR